MKDTPELEDLPPSLKLLKWLVIGLTAVMIIGVITMVAVFVTRMPKAASPPVIPAQLQLPEGSTAEAVTMGRDFIAIVTQDQRVLIFRTDGSLRQEIALTPDQAKP